MFDIVKKGRMGFHMKGIDLRVEDSCEVVKSTRVFARVSPENKVQLLSVKRK